MFKTIDQTITHVDGGANANIFTLKRWFWKYYPIKEDIQQVTGQTAEVEGMGIVPIRIPKYNMIYLLYPCYHMPNNPQNTLGLTALKFYGKMRSVRLEALSWLKIVDKDGNTARTTTIPSFHKSQLMDYITIDIIHPTVTIPLSLKLPFK